MEIDADVNFQRRVWVGQRVGWVLIGIALMLSLVGLFGTGPASSASAEAPGLRIEYQRFARLQEPTKIHFSLGSSKGDSRLSLSRRYLDSVQVERVTPDPAKVESTGEWLVYHFGGQAPLAVTFHIRPEDFGTLTGAAQTADGASVVFHQFIYP